ncbi:MAG: Gfo/Idh/MocA family oxidoreductase [Anaerolineae bacterium]|nr:Gfo/Idh/MocA family oxidoreductase [Anaerolineae bacterium]
MVKNFAITGVAGYIAPRHLKAIKETGNRIVAALDPNDSVGLLDQYATDISFFTEFERFDRHLEKLRRGPESEHVHYVSICSPNYLHDAHCRHALRVGADVICEKPLVINPWNLEALQEIEAETGGRINTVLQLRVHPRLIELRERLLAANSGQQHEVRLTYITARGLWYLYSWKGDEEKSGGVTTNIGVHFFDLLLWLFGSPVEYRVYHVDKKRSVGFLELERARVQWFLSIDHRDLPFEPDPGVRTTYRSITVDGEEIEFTGGFTDLHTRVYEEILAGRGFGIEDARPSIELTYNVRQAPISPYDDMVHEMYKTGGRS